MKDKYLWYTDTHLDKLFPWTFFRFIRHIRKENPKGIFLTGDISNGILTCFHLMYFPFKLKLIISLNIPQH